MNKLTSCETLNLKNQLCHRFYVVSNAFTRAYRPFLEYLNLTYPQYVVMMSLWEEDAVDIGMLQKRTCIDRGALTLILKKMAQKNIIQIKASQKDKRRKIITLSDEGKTLKTSALNYPDRLGCNDLDLNKSDVKDCIALLDTIKYQLLNSINDRGHDDGH